MRKLCRCRHETIANLASEFGVSERTVRRDIEVLSITEPIYTQPGRYGGGVYVMEGYSVNRMYMEAEEAALLHKLYAMAQSQERCVLKKRDLDLLGRITRDYSKPKH